MGEELPRPTVWRCRRLLTEHAIDQLRLLDCTPSPSSRPQSRSAEVIEEIVLDEQGSLKELVLVVEWTRPLHVVVFVGEGQREERIVTVYEPDPNRWSADYRRRR